MHRTHPLLAIALMLPLTAAAAQQPSAAELLRDIERLSVVGNVLYVAAHPDDENTRLLDWLVEHQRVRAGYLSLTRGEGGQNLIGSEQAPLLGLIRTHELLQARSLDHAEQLFGNERDFGYSKTADETLGIWGHDQALGDVVWAIRKFKPDVIVTRFSPDDHQTHGHHTASAMLALEAFKAAADPQAFHDQLRWVTPWQARRIVWNKGVFGPSNPQDLTGFVAMDVGAYDPVLGFSTSEIAALSRSMHKTQGFGSSPSRGPAMEYFKVLAGDPIKTSFLDGLDQSWGRVPDAGALKDLLLRARAEFKPEDPAASIPLLLQARAALDALADNPWKGEKQAELQAVIAACAGLWLDATAAEPTAVPGDPLKVTLSAMNRSSAPLELESVKIQDEVVPRNKPLKINEVVALERTITLPSDAPITNPYWLQEEPYPGRWRIRDEAFQSLPEQPPAIQVGFTVAMGTHKLSFTLPVVYAWNDPVVGGRRRPLEILPPVTANPRDPLLAFPDGADKELRATLHATSGPSSGVVKVELDSGFTAEPDSLPFTLGSAGAEQEVIFRIHPPTKLAAESASTRGTAKLKISLKGGAAVEARSVNRIEYSHLPILTVTPAARVSLVRFELKRPVARIGYIPGAGDEVPAALRQVGYEVAVLSHDMLAHQPLESYDAIVVGVRAFNTDPKLLGLHDRLMYYVTRGGTLLVQYNTQNRISKVAGPMGPWPFEISQDRVTDETAAVTRLLPEDPLFTTPNAIEDADFSGWVQERGLYFADSWDERFAAPLAMNDPGEPARKGSVLVARYGKGKFVYTGLAFFRQLPAGVPGAYRLFSNLLAHARPATAP